MHAANVQPWGCYAGCWWLRRVCGNVVKVLSGAAALALHSLITTGAPWKSGAGQQRGLLENLLDILRCSKHDKFNLTTISPAAMKLVNLICCSNR